MINDNIMKGTYVETNDNTLKELSRNLQNYERYKDIQPDSNQPAHLYGTAETHKLDTLEEITVANLKFDLSSIRLERLHTMQQKLY